MAEKREKIEDAALFLISLSLARGAPNETRNEFVICGARVAYLMMLDCDLIADKLGSVSCLMSNISSREALRLRHLNENSECRENSVLLFCSLIL